MKYGSIAAGEQTTLEAACHILESGGNAFDAAVASAFTSMTSEFALTSAGGGGALLALPYNSEPILFDFFVDTVNELISSYLIVVFIGGKLSILLESTVIKKYAIESGISVSSQ